MSKPKHTPGPWVAVIPSSPHICKGSDITNYSVFADNAFHDQAEIDNKTIISGQFTERLGLEESTANAHLIAAAPDMLETLEWVVKECGRAVCDLDPEISGHKCLIAAYAAIRKAKGES